MLQETMANRYILKEIKKKNWQLLGQKYSSSRKINGLL